MRSLAAGSEDPAVFLLSTLRAALQLYRQRASSLVISRTAGAADMKISEIRMWGFRCFMSMDASTKSASNPIAISFDPEITALIGRNGSGKSALLEALQRLFGETREERIVRTEDFFVSPGETIEKYPKREMFIEVLLSFPELKNVGGESQYTVPPAYNHMVVDGPGNSPQARIRLEATWQSAGTLDGVIEENIYWLLTTDSVSFGLPTDPNIKRRMTAAERASIAVRYIPASRDVTTLTKLTVRALGRSLLQSIHWQNEEKIRGLVKQASAALDLEESLKRVNDCINACWAELNAADTETTARLSVLSPDFQQIIRAASIALDPSPIGRSLGVEDLSDGQRSLFHFALVKSLLDFKLGLEADLAAGKKLPFRSEIHESSRINSFCIRGTRKSSRTVFSFAPDNRASEADEHATRARRNNEPFTLNRGTARADSSPPLE